MLDQLQTVPATERHVEAAEQVVDYTIRHMGRTMDTTDIRNPLYDNPEHPVGTMASRCLSCGNCTMVCPTCFCTSVEDHTSLSGEHTELAGLGLVLHHRLLLHARWQRPQQREVPLPAVDDP